MAKEQVTMGVAMLAAAGRWPERPFGSFPDKELTFAALAERATALGRRLAAKDVRPGDHVGILMHNSPECLEAFFGITAIGAVPVVLNSRYRSDELPFVIEHADLVGLLTSEVVTADAGAIDFLERIENALPGIASDVRSPRLSVTEAPLLRFVAVLGDASRDWAVSWRFSENTGAADEVPLPAQQSPPRPDDDALVLYTSGTTSRPKGCVLSHAALLTAALEAYGRMGIQEEDVVWNPAPLCHVSAYVAMLGALQTGSTYLTSSHFDAQATLEQLERGRVTVAFANFPAFYLGLGAAMRETRRRLPNLRILTTAATAAEIERIRSMFPGVLQLSVTGSTEVGGCACVTSPTDPPEARAATAGTPLPSMSVTIRDQETGQVCGDGQVGEIWFAGATLLKRYHKDDRPVLTGAPDPGWFRTGDLGVLDGAGRLAFRGRIKDMLKVGGENVAAAEVEAFLLEHPAIEVAQVVAAPDERLGEVPAAFIQFVAGFSADLDDIREYCRSGIASFKVPRIIRVVEEWPMSATKIQKGRLREMLAESER